MKGWILITGAARRLGRATALELAKAGWDIALHYHTSHKEALGLAQDIRKLGRKTCLAKMDMENLVCVKTLIPALSAELGPLVGLVNNAALFLPDRMEPTGRRHRIVNYEAPRILSEAFYEQAPRDAIGSIVNLLDADPTARAFSQYNRSKKALEKLTLRMALDFAPDVRVNSIAPGPVLRGPRQSAAHFKRMAKATPLQSPVPTKAIAKAIRFLMEASCITGAVLPVDGGMHLKAKTGK